MSKNMGYARVTERRKAETKNPEPGVENVGVEPTASCMPCKRSGQLS